MATTSRPPDPPVDEPLELETEAATSESCEWRGIPPEEAYSEVEGHLREHPYEYQFFQAVRLLELLSRGRLPVGRFAHPAREAVRFGAHNSLPFPASQIQSLTYSEQESAEDGYPAPQTPDDPPKMTVNFMGLTGPVGVLPLVYTEFIVSRLRESDETMADFFDIFNHRMISFFYAAWEKYRFPVGYQRSRDDLFSRQLNCLLGIGTPGLEHRQQIDDDSLRFYTGLLALQPRSASALRDILIDYFGVPVEIEQFVGGWYVLKEQDQCCFEDGFTASEQLGIGSVVGDAIWDQQSRIRIRLGPMTMREYRAFLPDGGIEYQPLLALIRFFLNDVTDFEVQLVLRREEVPSVLLGSEDGGLPLGWITWMKSKPEFDRDPGDTVLRFEEA